MVVCPKPTVQVRRGSFLQRAKVHGLSQAVLIGIGLTCASGLHAQDQAADWQPQVRKYAEAKDWDSALRLVEKQIARAPQDMDVRAWRARVLAWAGKLPEAEKEYLEILKVSRTDPDNSMGLASVYRREGKLSDADRAISTAQELDPKRSDIHAARAGIFRAVGQRKEAQSEFQSALHLDPESAEARDGLITVRRGAQHELRIGQNNDLLSYSDGYHDEWMSVVSQWTSHWTTSVVGNSINAPALRLESLSGASRGISPIGAHLPWASPLGTIAR